MPVTGWQVELLGPAGLQGNADAWDRLNARVGRAHPLRSSRFIQWLLQQFGTGHQRLCIEHGTDGWLSACILQPVGGRRWTVFMPSGLAGSAVQTLACQPLLLRHLSAAKALLAALPGRAVALDLVGCHTPEAPFMPDDDGQIRCRWLGSVGEIDVRERSEDHWQARPVALRAAVTEAEQALLILGPLRLTTATLPNDGRAGMDDGADLAKAMPPSPTPAGWPAAPFWREANQASGHPGALTPHTLWAGDQAVAGLLMSVADGVPSVLAVTRDAAAGAHRAEDVLLKHLLARECSAADPPAGGMPAALRIRFNTPPSAVDRGWFTAEHPVLQLTLQRHPLLGSARAAWTALRASSQRPSAAAAAGNLHCSQVADAAALPPEARALMAVRPGRSMQLGVEWFDNYGRQLGPAAGRPRFALLWRAGQLIAVLPMAVQPGPGRGNRLAALANYYSSVYAPALADAVDAHDLAFLIDAQLRSLAPVHQLRFAPMDRLSREYTLLHDALRHCGLLTAQYFCFGNWYLPAAGLRWPPYLASRNGALRSTLQRMGKRFAHAGGRLEIITGGDRLAPGIAAYQQVYGASWKQAEPHPAFVAGLMQTCAAQGWLRLGIAWLGGQPVAAQLWIVANGRAEIYKLAYDEAVKRFSPGTLLTAELMQQTLTHDAVIEVDYLTGDDDYKASWMGHRRARWGLIAHNPRTVAGAVGAAAEIAGRVWRALRPLFGPRPKFPPSE